MPVGNKRLLLAIDRARREENRETLNPAILQLTVESLRPTLKLVARARADFLGALLALADDTGEDQLPDRDHIKELRSRRIVYEELVAGARALEVAVERGYIDVSASATEECDDGDDVKSPDATGADTGPAASAATDAATDPETAVEAGTTTG